MDTITNIAFYNTGNTFTNSAGEDYYDIITPGVAILSADDSTYILFYDGSEVSKIDKKKEGLYDWSKEVAEFLIKKNKYDTSTEFLSGLLMCADNEDEDGLYDFIQENGGEIVFDSPNNEINSDIGIFVIKQIGEAQSTEDVSIKTDGSNLFINDEKIELSQLSSGHFDSYQDPILVYARQNIVSIETTGINTSTDKIVEIAALKIDKNNLKSLFHQIINPEKEIDKNISNIIGYSNEELKKYPKITEINESFVNFINSSTLIGHNNDFIFDFLNKE